MLNLLCWLNIHWWEYPNCDYLPSIHAPIVEELIYYRKCKICGKKEITEHCVWNYNTRNFDEKQLSENV
jgi:hypothetical protein